MLRESPTLAFMSLISYQNPVWDGCCADPFVLKYEDFYYCYGTDDGTNALLNGRQFVCLRSRDLVNWEFLGGALEPLESDKNGEYWAPEVAFRDGKFWMYFSNNQGGTNSRHRLSVAVSDSPSGPFRVVKRHLMPNDEFTIDAHPFCDPQSGKWYLFFARDFFDGRVGTGTAVVELDDDMMSVVGDSFAVVRASADWQIYERDLENYGKIWEAWHTVEGAFVVWKDGLYYCFYAGGNWTNESYGASFAVANHPLGPWRDEHSAHGALVLRGRSDAIGPGHNSVVLGPDGHIHVCVYHAWDTQKTKRQLCIDPIEWTESGPKVEITRGGGVLRSE